MQPSATAPLSARSERAPVAPKLELVPALSPERVELDALNEELKVLRSSDEALKAYVLTWVSFVSLSVTAKLVWDWMHSVAKAPTLAVPVGAIGLLTLVLAVAARVKKHRLSGIENKKLARQKQLREKLGIGDFHFE